MNIKEEKNTNWTDYFTRHPCEDGWLAFSSQTPHAFWNTTQRSDWLWWWMRFNRKGYLPPKATSAMFAHDCSERAQIYACTKTERYVVNNADKAARYANAANYADTDDSAADYTDDTIFYSANAAYSSDINFYAELAWQADWIREHIKYPFVS